MLSLDVLESLCRNKPVSYNFTPAVRLVLKFRDNKHL